MDKLYIKFFCVIFILVFLTSCSIRQVSYPLQERLDREIYILEDPNVRAGFLNTLEATLLELGYVPIVIKNLDQQYDKSKAYITYTGLWSWDYAIYLSYALIKVFKNGKVIGTILYDSTEGKLNPYKFVVGKDKVRDLTLYLFPPYKPIISPSPLIYP